MIRDAQEAGAQEFRTAVAGVVADVLTPAQRKRLRQIDLQARGHEALATAAVAKALDLSAKQKEQLEANAKRVEEELAGAFQKPGITIAAPAGVGGIAVSKFDPTEFDKGIRETRAEGLKRALAVLTEEQKGAWKKLAGEPFAHPLDRPVPMRSWSTSAVIQGGAVPALPAVPLPGANAVPGKAVPALPARPVNPPAVKPGN